VVTTVALVGCHSTLSYQDQRKGEVRTQVTSAPPRVLPVTAVVTARGTLRFVQPLLCATDTITDLATFDVVRTRPRAATVIIGVIATGVGFIFSARSVVASGSDRVSNGIVGGVGLGVGLPLMIGPLFGNATIREPIGVTPLARPGPDQSCGERPASADHATFLWSGLHIEGAVDDSGEFAVSPFDVVDGFEARLPSMDVAIDLDGGGRRLRLSPLFDASTLAAARPGFFAAHGIDTTIPALNAMEKLPQYELGDLAVTLSSGPALHVALPIDNVGPGDGYGLRIVLASSSPEIDGRVIYVGRLPAHGHAVFDATIGLSVEGERAVTGPAFTIAALARDGIGLAPPTPIRLRGIVLRTGS
jgi:hypothetical protein